MFEEIFQNQSQIIFGLPLLLFLWLTVKILSTKRVYFIRHGETILNLEHIRQAEKGVLTEKGRAQAKEVGARLSKMHIKDMYVSPYQRTQETAQIIYEYSHIPFTLTKLLTERKNPSEIVGKKFDDIEVERIINQIDLASHDVQKLTPLVLATVTYLTTINNGGITLVAYSPLKFLMGKNPWSIIVFDDQPKAE